MDKQTLRNSLKYIVVLGIGILAILLTILLTNPKKGGQAQESGTATDPTETEETVFAPENAPALDTAKVEDLLMRYYAAKTENDADTLNQIVESDSGYTVTVLADEMQYISRYDNFYTYVYQGPADGWFIAYVTYDIYFTGIETGAPAMNHYVIRKDSNDTYVIYDRGLSDEYQEYLTKTESTEMAEKLRDQVEEDLKKACSSDPDLRELMRLLSGEDPVEESSESEETESGESESGADATESGADESTNERTSNEESEAAV